MSQVGIRLVWRLRGSELAKVVLERCRDDATEAQALETVLRIHGSVAECRPRGERIGSGCL
eukprot:10886076-Lingulodinium_polyedra.AAC.1